MHLGVCDSKDDADGLLHFTEGKQVGTIVRLVRKERHTMNDTVFNLMSHSAAVLGLKGPDKKKTNSEELGKVAPSDRNMCLSNPVSERILTCYGLVWFYPRQSFKSDTLCVHCLSKVDKQQLSFCSLSLWLK